MGQGSFDLLGQRGRLFPQDWIESTDLRRREGSQQLSFLLVMHITFGRNQAITNHNAEDLPLAWELLEVVCLVYKNIGQALGGREQDLGGAKQAA
jgi:hypothetical protein